MAEEFNEDEVEKILSADEKAAILALEPEEWKVDDVENKVQIQPELPAISEGYVPQEIRDLAEMFIRHFLQLETDKDYLAQLHDRLLTVMAREKVPVYVQVIGNHRYVVSIKRSEEKLKIKEAK